MFVRTLRVPFVAGVALVAGVAVVAGVALIAGVAVVLAHLYHFLYKRNLSEKILPDQ